MANLKKLLGDREVILSEQNIREGESQVFVPAGRSQFSSGFDWIAPGAGTVIIEVWGAGGSGASRCCCSFGMPGNSGAYSKKTISVASGCRICGNPGVSCTPCGCNPGCSQSSEVCYAGTSGTGCICAQGGKGGIGYCVSSSRPFCCIIRNDQCHTVYNGGCGIGCNTCDGAWIPSAFGGDENKDGLISCIAINCCYMRSQAFDQYIAMPPGLHGKEGTVAVSRFTNPGGDNSQVANYSYGYWEAMSAFSKISKMPHGGAGFASCWSGSQACTCYQRWNCFPGTPIGSGGSGFLVCCCYSNLPSGTRGGYGAIRIRFIED